ncbi:MAG: ROK family transcriptional regulator [Jannaschia sp.]
MNFDPQHRRDASDPEQPEGAIDSRQAGRARVLGLIRHGGRMARVDIARQTGLSPATVTAITAELLAEGLIERILPDPRSGSAGRGRPREALKVRGAAKLVAGLKVSRLTITVLLVDFEGADIGTHDFHRPEAQSTGEALADQMVEATAEACARHGRALAEVSAIGVGLAGQIDGARGHVHWSSALLHRNVELGDMLRVRAPCPVFIENDANLVAKAEQLFGKGRGVGSFLVVTLQHGVGMGVVIDGQLHRGARGCGAEFGHTKVCLDGAPCQCGQLGCLEAYAGEYALLRRANAAGLDRYTDIGDLSQAARAGDPVVGPILDEAGRYFAMSLANLVNIFDPELLILAVETATEHPLCTPAVLARVAAQTVQVDVSLPDIRVHHWGDRMWAKGAAAYGIEKISDLSVLNVGRADA